MNFKSFFAVALIASSLSAFAANTDTLLLRGTVNGVCEIAVAEEGNANLTLDILNGGTDVLVAKATETCNRRAGYQVSMKSINGNKLVNPAGNATGYTLSYDGATAAEPGTAGKLVKTSGLLSGLTVDVSDIKVNVTALPTALEGTYEDTVTFTIQAI